MQWIVLPTEDKSTTENSFERLYPNIANWIDAQSWIEIGQDEYSRSLVRCIDMGGMRWESSNDHQTIDEALQALEEAVKDLLKEYTWAPLSGIRHRLLDIERI